MSQENGGVQLKQKKQKKHNNNFKSKSKRKLRYEITREIMNSIAMEEALEDINLSDLYNHLSVAHEESENDDLDTEFLEYIIGNLVRLYGIKEEEAVDIVEKSVVINLLDTNPDYVYHYDSIYWAESIFKAHRQRKV